MKTTHGTFGRKFGNRRHSAFCAIVKRQAILDLHSALILEIVDVHRVIPDTCRAQLLIDGKVNRNCGEETNILSADQRL